MVSFMCVSPSIFLEDPLDGPLQSCIAPGLLIPSEFTFYLTLEQLVYSYTFDIE